MIIDENVKNRLLTWNDDEPIYKQFEEKCATLSQISGLVITPDDYQVQYEAQKSSVNYYMDSQTELYGFLYKKYPNVEFAMAGRLKSPFSYYEKVIRKFIEQLSKDEFRIVEVLDVYAIKVFLLSINYPVDKVSVDTEGIYIDSGANEFRIDKDDCFEFIHKGKVITALVNEGATNVYVDNSTPRICTTRNNEDFDFPLNTANTYKKSSKEHLVKYCYKFQEDIAAFYNDKNFNTRKMKDYIASPKDSGYSSLQWSFYSEDESLGIECQTRTYDMEKFNNKEREYGYKPNEHKLSRNALKKVPRFALTTRTNFSEEGYTTWKWDEAECFEYLFGTSLKEYRKKMLPTVEFKNEALKREKEDETR
ncbi:MAG: hypothetical protein HFJ57_02420 [Clostridia bacterium]|nr:hypothetical protein [Clostridia bacterium]